jgi:hypothetical protein
VRKRHHDDVLLHVCRGDILLVGREGVDVIDLVHLGQDGTQVGHKGLSHPGGLQGLTLVNLLDALFKGRKIEDILKLDNSLFLL